MAIITGRAYKINDASRWLFETLYPDMDKEAKYFLVSSAGTLTFTDEPENYGVIHTPHSQFMTYIEIQFDDTKS